MRETYANVHGKDMVHKQPITLINENAYYNKGEMMLIFQIVLNIEKTFRIIT